MWNAPDAMNRMWSVFTMPYLVLTVLPSTSGSRSRCTPSRETSTPDTEPCWRAILSISSRKTMPFCSALRSAWALSSSSLTSFAASSSVSSLNASWTLSRRERVRAAAEAREHALQLLRQFLHAGRRHDLDARRHRAQLDLDLALVELALAQHLAEALARVVVPAAAAPVPRCAGRSRAVGSVERGRGSSSSRMRSSAASIARWRTFSISCSRVIFTATSTRSLMIESTSRPT